MALFDLFSKRMKQKRGEVPDVYVYEELPNPLRVQIIHIIRDGIETAYGPDEHSGNLYKRLHDILAREYGLFELHEDAKGYRGDFASAFFNFFLQTKDIERALDVVEVSFRAIVLVVPEWYGVSRRRASAEDTVSELNARFQQHGVGYRFEAGQIIRVDSEYVHSEIIMPAIQLLASAEFSGPSDEFLKAHEHYRHGRNKEALVEALKALESTIKVIARRRSWSHPPDASAKTLISLVFEKELIPAALQSHFNGVRTTLEGGIPTVRNKLSGHGQGPEPTTVPNWIAAYGLSLAAAAIRLLAEADENAA